MEVTAIRVRPAFNTIQVTRRCRTALSEFMEQHQPTLHVSLRLCGKQKVQHSDDAIIQLACFGPYSGPLSGRGCATLPSSCPTALQVLRIGNANVLVPWRPRECTPGAGCALRPTPGS